MILARIDGHVTSSFCDASLKGQTIVLCTPLDEKGEKAGEPFAALDPLGAGRHATVFITTDGSWTQKLTGCDNSPIRNQVMGLVDVS
ncbi:EutN/CcmL family microcompartment protein [Pelagicoccus albus]|uniref:EutN/CcmL family microcompartment protein n=1 Tax=Pelagicoccus albus TaxID=415222 RepID=A0A7X1B457_9BACT|nr:EutN/CcmL family microcompartment protein [Pelagicoccus albus]MBC2605222.1 EutN/CcmL family microcompartment protein [Pelagicoccus albus]